MITPRRTRLVRVPDLHAFREAIAALCEPANAALAPRRGATPPGSGLVVVPTRGAARQLQRRAPAADCVTRDELYDRLHARLEAPPRRLAALEREVIAQRAAREARSRTPGLSFRLRPGLVAEMLRFYDHLRRHAQQVNRFEELIVDALGGDDDLDRGAERMRNQTRFLAEAFREYERRVRESDGCDEHVLRDRLIAEPVANPIRHVVVTVPDWIADADGLFVADFDLLSRIPGLETLDIVATDGVLRSGFHERLHNWWPGLEEINDDHSRRPASAAPAVKPVLIVPPSAPPEEPWWTLRDREEELVSIARQIKADRRAGDGVPLDRFAIVFKRPLPYLYLAAETLPAAGIPYQTVDTLPLAVEPGASAVDVALEAVGANFGRGPLTALLRSPHLMFVHEDIEVSRESISALDRRLSDARYLGELSRLEALASEAPMEKTSVVSAFRRTGTGPAEAGHYRERDAAPALHAVVAAAHELAPLVEPHPASEQVTRLLSFWESHLRPLTDTDPLADRERRSRAAVRDALVALATVHARHDDPDWTIDDLALAVRRTIEEHTFEPDPGGGGVHLLDDQAARYGDFDDVAIVGIVESEWPERPRRNIFYPPGLLKALGWPSENDRRAAADARFLELVASASRRTILSTFTLDDDALVSRSTQLDDVHRARLSTVEQARSADARIFVDEALSIDPPALDAVPPVGRPWADIRLSRSPATAAEYHGQLRLSAEAGRDAGGTGTGRTRAWSVSSLETYLDCPFKFFAQHVLRLQEEPDDEEVMDPRRQGRFVHQVFEQFFRAWQAVGHRAITPSNLDAAREMFTAVADRALESLPDAEAGLERTRLLGSPAAAGLGDAVFRMEAERPVPVVERLLEHELRGDFTFTTADGERIVTLRGKVDRLDLLEDGTFRLIDYKLGWPPNRARALQLPIYSLCAEQRLVAHRGRTWKLGEAVYLAFKGPKRVVPLFSAAERVKVLTQAQQRLVDTIDAIAAGTFPPTPDDVYRCEMCTFASVCRKDYVGEV